MAYSRFWDSDIYIYPHVDGYIECAACFLNIPQDEDTIFQSTEIHDDNTLIIHVLRHIISGHKVPEGLVDEILEDPDRYGKIGRKQEI